MPTYNYCTLFDSNYLIQGLALYESLLIHCKGNFHLYIFAFDDLALGILKRLNLMNATVISLEEFEDEDLLKVKPLRTKGEYCWTCTSSIILYSIKKFNLNLCTYLDADIYFFNDPAVLLNELGNDSVLITPHWYSREYQQKEKSGLFCVHFTSFKNDENGITALEWWKDRCIEWCYSRHEDGKFGDQMYLNDWPERFKGIRILSNRGGGIAPWNLSQYNFHLENDNVLFGMDNADGKIFTAIFYHFHEFEILSPLKYDLSCYKLSGEIIKYFYIPYIKSLTRQFELLKKNGIDNYCSKKKNSNWFKKRYTNIKRRIIGTYMVIKYKG